MGPRQLREFLQVSPVHIRDRPVFHPSCSPADKVVAALSQELLPCIQVPARGPDEEIDDVLSAVVDEGGDSPAVEKVEPAAGGTVRQHVQIQQGIPQEKAKDIVRIIKDSKAKVQASIQGDMVRVTGRDRDTLQQVIANLKAKDLGINMQFTNYRSN